MSPEHIQMLPTQLCEVTETWSSIFVRWMDGRMDGRMDRQKDRDTDLLDWMDCEWVDKLYWIDRWTSG